MKRIGVLLLCIPALANSQVNVSTYENVDTVIVDDAVLVGPNGNVYGSHFEGTRVYKMSPEGSISIFADGLNGANGLEFDSSDNLYVIDHHGGKVHTVTPEGVQTELVSSINRPSGIIKKQDSDTMYVTQYVDHTIVKVAPDGSVSPFISGDLLAGPVGLAYDEDGELYTGNFDNRKIIHISEDGTQSEFATIPGGSWLGFICYEEGHFYGTSFNSSKVYQVRKSDTLISLLAGSTIGEVDGDTSIAKFNRPNGITTSTTGDSLFVSDYGTGNIRIITGFKNYAGLQSVELSQTSINIYPNPAVQNLNVKLNLADKREVDLRIINAKGQIFEQKRVLSGSGTNVFDLNVSSLSNGIYFLEIQIDDSVFYKQFIIDRY